MLGSPGLIAFVVGLAWLSSSRGPARSRSPGTRSRPVQAHRFSWRRSRSSPFPDEARWAGRRDISLLRVQRPSAGRVCLGKVGRHLLAAERSQSVIVIGPTQTHKTSGFAIPAILEWKGPLLATSVKGDLLRETLRARSTLGKVWLYDPSESIGGARSCWTPLSTCLTWQDARRQAANLCSSGKLNSGSFSDADFWYSMAAKLLAPLLLAGALGARTMSDVVAWVDEQELREADEILVAHGQEPARRALHASWAREERQRGSIYSTLESVLEAFADPAVAATTRGGFTASQLLDGGQGTLYVCSPAHEQQRLRSLFGCIVQEVLHAAYEMAARTGKPLDPPLLCVLDEAANIAPLEELDSLASTSASHGIELVSIWQDMAQISARYGERSATVVNNHRAKVVLSGISDPTTLSRLSALAGESSHGDSSETRDSRGQLSRTTSQVRRPLAPADSLRRMRPGQGILIYGHLPPVILRLRPWYRDRHLTILAGSGFEPSSRRLLCKRRSRCGGGDPGR